MGRLSEFDDVELRAMGYRKPTLSRPFKLANFGPKLGELRVWFLTREEHEHARRNAQGICLACGELQDGCPSDTSRRSCSECGESTVYDIFQARLDGRVALDEESEAAE